MDIVIIILLSLILVLAIIIFALIYKNRFSRGYFREQLSPLEAEISRLDTLMRDEFARGRSENSTTSRENREELINSFKILGETLRQTVGELADAQKRQFDAFSERQEGIRRAIDGNLKEIREETAKKLEEMRKTVDENLKDTVEKRFNDSFRLISERLEQVQKGLGEMQQLASGVGDLKRVLTNVKTKGSLGEIQLGSILEQILSPAQYESQVTVKDDRERVDYVVKLPDKNSVGKTLFLPIDSKFPTEDYQRLLDAYDRGNSDDEQKRASSAFETAVKKCARDIRDKYINPPVTTDFAIMFVPTEGLYAEVVRRADLFENLQRQYNITVVGPANLSAFLSSLQMGFRTLAIERRSNEVWNLLGAVKTEFGKYGDLMDKIKNKIDLAAKEIDSVGTRSRAIERKLRTVEELPESESDGLLAD